ncbi:MAG: lipoyl synthase [Caldilineales bacterium]|nr:lipoyl synthase [Caldilineales bacterium]MCW5859508.1 lipoyl synthase [Caldilineales bacterium]
MPTPIELDPAPPRHNWHHEQLTRGRRPEWLRVRATGGAEYNRLYDLMRGHSLHTVCEEAGCPNISECWNRGAATFLLLGDTCTRSCGFCKIKTGRPTSVDILEPLRVARTVQQMNLRHVVLTSVNRDELPDGGAFIFAATVRKIRELRPGCTVEVLIPDFMGDAEALRTVMRERPEILNHNTETVPRLYRRVRPQARYERSLEVLRRAKDMDGQALTKSGLMLGLGERWEEVIEVMEGLRSVDADILTLGQYLQPTRFHLPIERYYTPAEFEELRRLGEAMGFRWVESGPLVRSSYHADGQARLTTRADIALAAS